MGSYQSQFSIVHVTNHVTCSSIPTTPLSESLFNIELLYKLYITLTLKLFASLKIINDSPIKKLKMLIEAQVKYTISYTHTHVNFTYNKTYYNDLK
jgi:hypothetical protein